jgi:recombination protein RecR
MSTQSAYPPAMQRLIELFGRLPGIGRRTAERLTLAILEWPDDMLARFGDELLHLKERVTRCPECGNFAAGDRCAICRSPARRRDVICVVEHAAQIGVIEKSGSFQGLYHVLGGKLVPLENKGPEELRVAELRERLAGGGITEVIVATSPDVEGEATAHYLAEEFADLGITFSRIAAGVPVGADLTYADAATLAMALGGRRTIG